MKSPRNIAYAILASALLFPVLAFHTPDTQIQWQKSRPLAWQDFKGTPDNSLPYYAQTAGAFSYSFEGVSPSHITVKIKVQFDPAKSWVKRGAETPYLLNHEQKHFDIWEAHARYFIRSLKKDTQLTQKNFSARASIHFKEAMRRLNKIQEKYDNETNHSLIESQQALWDDKISKVLVEMEAYSDREIQIKLR